MNEIIEPLFEIMVIGNEEACIAHLKKYPELLTKILNRADATIFHLASHYNLPRVLDYVIKQKVDLHEKNRQEKNAVFYADSEIIMRKLHKAGISFNELNTLGHTPLIMSGFFNNYNKIKWLIENGADVNVKDRYNNTILDYIEDGNETFDIHFLMTYYEQFSPENQKKLKKIRLKQLVERGNFHLTTPRSKLRGFFYSLFLPFVHEVSFPDGKKGSFWNIQTYGHSLPYELGTG